MMIGLLAYHSVCNYGAFLQLLSTVKYLNNRGYESKVINWVPEDLERDYFARSTEDVRKIYSELRRQFFSMTTLCRSSKDVAKVIEIEDIDSIIIGSDAVCQHHPFFERFHFPTKKIVSVSKLTSDRMFPNPFWGSFNHYLVHPIPIAMISGSSQNSNYKYIIGRTRKQMSEAIKSFNYVSVRDDWTQRMFSYLTGGDIVPSITPDPVFAFNYNAQELVPTKEEILKKFSLPDNYFLLSFKGNSSVDQKWISSFEEISNRMGYACVNLPYPDFPPYGECRFSICNPLSPLDWYGLIKYSGGYVGNNMHPIVVSIHNCVPFFSFDNYGIKSDETSSKIFHVLKNADLLENRVFIRKQQYRPPMPSVVLRSLLNFDISKEMDFSEFYYHEYQIMMGLALNSLK